MVNAAQAIDAVSNGPSLVARAPSVSAVLSSGAVPAADAAAQAVTSAQSAATTNLSRTLLYNSFEFSYRQDFGKIVLLHQKPESGEVVQQFPSEYYLSRYAQSERAARHVEQNPSPSAADGADSAPKRTAALTADAATGQATKGGGGVADLVPSAPAAVPSAPALPSGGVGGGVGGAVDITI